MQRGKRRPAGRRGRRDSRRRLTAVLCLATAALIVISGRLFTLQVLDSRQLTAMALAERTRPVDTAVFRGTIYDRDGRDLAISVDARTIIADPFQISDPVSVAQAIAPVIRRPWTVIEQLLRLKVGFVYLARNVPVAVGNAVGRLHLPGITVGGGTARVYPEGSAASQVVGVVGTDGTGLSGLEEQYNNLLESRSGDVSDQVEPGGQVIPGSQHVVSPPVAGSDLVTTLDSNIQYVAAQALQGAVERYHAIGGSIVVEVPHSGQVLAMVNEPTFNPDNLANVQLDTLQNRAVSNVYEPGSVNKVITASAALQAKVVKPSTPITIPSELPMCPGHAFHDAEAHGLEVLPFSQVIAQSSNIGTIEVAERLGRRRLSEAEHAFGYGQPTGLNFPGESDGIVHPVSQWRCTDFGANAIGQGVAVNVMQMASVYSTVANGGVWVQPSLVLGTVNRKGTFAPAPPPHRHRVISAATAHTMTGILEKVVEGNGTGVLAAMSDYSVAGKTGTAQIAGPNGYIPGAYTASFIGFAPASHPALVIAVVLDRPTPVFGGLVSAPTFKLVAQYALGYLGVLPSGGTPPPAPGTVISGGDVAGAWVVPASTAATIPSGTASSTPSTAPPTTRRTPPTTGHGTTTTTRAPPTTTTNAATSTAPPTTTTRPPQTTRPRSTTTTATRGAAG